MLLVGPDWRIHTVSANVGMLGDHRPADLISQPLAELVGSRAIHSLRNRLAWLSSDESEVHDFGVQWGHVTLDVRASREEETYLIEAELAVEPRLPDAIGMVRSMTDRLNGKDPSNLAEQAARQLCALTGFDRIALVDRNGGIVASAGRQMRPLGPQRPVEANELPRLIADRDAEAVPLVGDAANPLLSKAAFLAPSDSQLQSLNAEGAAASMTFPLRIDGEMTGMMHARHPSPRRCGAERRSIAHLFAERLAARMVRNGWKP